MMTDKALALMRGMYRKADWLPIETAPKNTTVLVGTTDHAGNCGFPVVMARLSKSQTKLTTGKYWGWNHTGAAWTHWMSIPEPPE